MSKRTGIESQVIICVVACAAIQTFLVLTAFFNPPFTRDVPFLSGHVLAIAGWCILCSSLYRYVRRQAELIDGWAEISEYTTSVSYECTRLREENEKLIARIDELTSKPARYIVGG